MIKSFLFLLLLVLSMPVLADEYNCKIKEGSSTYYYLISPRETAADFCLKLNELNTSDYFKCIKTEYPKTLNAYKQGNCEKLSAPKRYNIKNCNCWAKSLKDGTIVQSGCVNQPFNPKCDIEVSQQILDKMLYKF